MKIQIQAYQENINSLNNQVHITTALKSKFNSVIIELKSSIGPFFKIISTF